MRELNIVKWTAKGYEDYVSSIAQTPRVRVRGETEGPRGKTLF